MDNQYLFHTYTVPVHLPESSITAPVDVECWLVMTGKGAPSWIEYKVAMLDYFYAEKMDESNETEAKLGTWGRGIAIQVCKCLGLRAIDDEYDLDNYLGDICMYVMSGDRCIWDSAGIKVERTNGE